MGCLNLVGMVFSFSALLLVIKLVIGVPRLKKKESKRFVNSMPKYLTVRKLFIHIIMLTRTGWQRNILEDVISALCHVVC